MTQEETMQFLQWCFEDILKNVWDDSTEDPQKLANILARANMGHMVLTGTDAMREQIFSAFEPSFQEKIKNIKRPDW